MAKFVGFKRGKIHEKYVISDYYCGGCGYPVTDHDSFCPECGGAFRECDANYFEDERVGTCAFNNDFWKSLTALQLNLNRRTNNE